MPDQLSSPPVTPSPSPAADMDAAESLVALNQGIFSADPLDDSVLRLDSSSSSLNFQFRGKTRNPGSESPIMAQGSRVKRNESGFLVHNVDQDLTTDQTSLVLLDRMSDVGIVYDGSGDPSFHASPAGAPADERGDSSGPVVADTQLPTTDHHGAVQSLNPKQLVSATAIELAMRTIFPCDDGCVRFLDPSYIDIRNPVSVRKKPPLRLQATHRHLLVPINSNNHWSLAHIDVSNQTISYYDSWPDTETQTRAREAISIFVKHLESGLDKSKWSFNVGMSAVQDNSYDCGVFLLVNALHLVLSDFKHLDPKISVDCTLWRKVFQSVINSEPCRGTSTEEEHVPADIAPTLIPNASSRASLEQLMETERQRRNAHTQSLQIFLAMSKSSLTAAKTNLQQSESIVALLNTALDRNQGILTVAAEKATSIESELGVSERLICEYSTLKICKKEALESLRVGQNEARQKSERLKRKVEVYQRGLVGLQAAVTSAVSARDSRERCCRQLEEEAKGIFQLAREFWHEQHIIAQEQERKCIEDFSTILT